MTDTQARARELYKAIKDGDNPHLVIAGALIEEREACAEIALAIDSGRGNEKEIAKAIKARA